MRDHAGGVAQGGGLRHDDSPSGWLRIDDLGLLQPHNPGHHHASILAGTLGGALVLTGHAYNMSTGHAYHMPPGLEAWQAIWGEPL